MRNRRFAIKAVFVIVCLAATASAANLKGKWKGDMKTFNGDVRAITFNFQVNGEKLTGTVADTHFVERITEGTVKDDSISFVIMANKGLIKVTYLGTVVGEDLNFKVTIGDTYQT